MKNTSLFLIGVVSITSLVVLGSPFAYGGGPGGGGGGKWSGGWGGKSGGGNWRPRPGNQGGNGGAWGNSNLGSNSTHNPSNSQSGSFWERAIKDAEEKLKRKAAQDLHDAMKRRHHHDDGHGDGPGSQQGGGYQQPAPIPAPKPTLPPANKLPQPSILTSLPRVDERYQSSEGQPPAAVPSGVRIVNPVETGRSVQFSFAGQDHRLDAGKGALLRAEDDSRIVFEASPSAAEPTVYSLAAGQTYAFSYAAGKWSLVRSVVRFQTTVDNSQNPFAFYFLANASEQVIEPYKSRVLSHAAPLTLTFDTGNSQSQRKIHQSNISNFRLGNRVKVQGEDRIEVVHETHHKVALGEQGRWVLVDKSNWRLVKAPVASQPERIVETSPESIEEAAGLDDDAPTKAQPSTVKITGAAPEEPEIPPKLYVLAIGVSKYQDARYNLSFAHRDAEAFGEVWKQQAGLMYREVEARVLTNEQATKQNIESALGWLEKQVTKRDNAVIMVSGHGMLDAKNRFYIATHDMDSTNLKATCVPRSSLEDTLSSLSGGQALVFLDTCHSGQNFGTGGFARKGGFGIDVLKDLPDAGQGVVVFTSSQANEVSVEKDLWGHGAFTKAFLDATQDPHVTDLNGDGFLAINELDFALQERVKNLTEGQQHPSYDKSQGIKTGGRIMRLK